MSRHPSAQAPGRGTPLRAPHAVASPGYAVLNAGRNDALLSEPAEGHLVKPVANQGMSSLWGAAARGGASAGALTGSSGATAFQNGSAKPAINFANLPKLGSQPANRTGTASPAPETAGRTRGSVSSLFGGPSAASAPAPGDLPAGNGAVVGGSAPGGPVGGSAVAAPVSAASSGHAGSSRSGGRGNRGGDGTEGRTAGSGGSSKSGHSASSGSGSGGKASAGSGATSSTQESVASGPSGSSGNASFFGGLESIPEISPANGRASLASILPGLGGARPQLSIFGSGDSNVNAQDGDLSELPSDSFDTGSIALPGVPVLQSLGLDGADGLEDVPTGNSGSESSHSAVSAAAQLPSMERFGLSALLSLVNSDVGEGAIVPALGTDTASLGLEASTTGEQLSRTFGSPWGELAKHNVVPRYRLPESYAVSSIVPAQQKLQNLTEETLFYIFYSMPHDAMQEAAAVELSNRNWRYHKDLKLWLTKDPMSEPVQQTSQAETGMYVFFDPSTWEKVKREYVLHYPDIT